MQKKKKKYLMHRENLLVRTCCERPSKPKVNEKYKPQEKEVIVLKVLLHKSVGNEFLFKKLKSCTGQFIFKKFSLHYYCHAIPKMVSDVQKNKIEM